MMRGLLLFVVTVACADSGTPTMRVENRTTSPAQGMYVYWYDSAGGPLVWSDNFPPGSSACRVIASGPAFVSVADAANVRLEMDVVLRDGEHWLLLSRDGANGRATVTFTEQGDRCQ